MDLLGRQLLRKEHPTTPLRTKQKMLKAASKHVHRHLYGDPRWRDLRRSVFAAEPICRVCKDAVATEVDHVKPHRGDESLFFSGDNLQPICSDCHKKKTRRDRW